MSDRAEGTRRVYALNPHAFASLRDAFDQFWNQALDAFKRRVESGDLPPGKPAAHRSRRKKEHHHG